MLRSRANLRVLCYNYSGAIARPQRQRDLSTFRDKYNEFDLFEDIKYTLDEDFLDEMLSTITENRRD